MICSSISNIFSEFITVTASELAFSNSDVSCLFSELSSSEEFKTLISAFSESFESKFSSNF